jgi:hypothetical protein
MDAITFSYRGQKVLCYGESVGTDWIWNHIYVADCTKNLYSFFDGTILLAEIEEAATQAMRKQEQERQLELESLSHEAIDYREAQERRCT